MALSSEQLPPDAIDAVLFDAGGVLLLPDPEAGRSAARSLGCETDKEDWRRAHYMANLVLDRMETPDWPAVRRAVAAAVGIGDDHLEAAVPLIEQLIVATPWVAVDGAARTLHSLSLAGYSTAIVSNAFGTVETELEELGICSIRERDMPRVGVVIDSHVVGIAKPDPRIFHLALDALGVEPARALYIGDTVKYDVVGALAAGLHPVHLDPFGLCEGEHMHITTLGDLIAWLVPR